VRKKRARLCVKFQSESLESTTNCGRVIWALPPQTLYSEGRSCVQLDGVPACEQIKSLIDVAKTYSDAKAIRYFNTIAPLVKVLQENSHLQLAQHNVFSYLFTSFYERFAKEKLVADLQCYNVLFGLEMHKIHPLLLRADWLSSIATNLSVSGEIKVFIAEMPGRSKDESPLVYLEDEAIVLIEKSYSDTRAYQALLDELKFLLSLSKGEISTQFFSHHLEQIWTPQEVVYDDGALTNPYHDLYQKHGSLWHLGDTALDEVAKKNPGMLEILSDSPSCVTALHCPMTQSSARSEYKFAPKNLLMSFLYKNQKVYVQRDSTNKLYIYDEFYQVLYGGNVALLAEKISQYKSLSQAKSENSELVINNNDIFVRENKTENRKYCVNRYGEEIDPRFSGKQIFVTRLVNGYFLISNYISYIYHPNYGVVFDNESESWWQRYNIISDDLVEILSENANCKTILMLKSNGATVFQSDMVLYDNNFIFIQDNTQWRFYNIKTNQNILKIAAPTSTKSAYFHLEQKNTNWHLTILDVKGGTSYFVMREGAIQQSYDSSQTMGYPVTALMPVSPSVGSSIIVETNEEKIRGTLLRIIDPDVMFRKKYGAHYEKYYERQSAALLRRDKFYIISDVSGNKIIDAKGRVYNLPSSIYAEDIAEIYSKKNHCIIETNKYDSDNVHKRKSYKFIIQRDGVIRAEGFHVRLLCDDFGIIQVGDNILNNAGTRMNKHPVRFALPEYINNKALIEVHYKKNSSGESMSDLWDVTGNSVLPPAKRNGYISVAHDYFSYGEPSVLQTPRARIPNATCVSKGNSPDLYEGLPNNALIYSSPKAGMQLYTRRGDPYFKEVVENYFDYLHDGAIVLRPSKVCPHKHILSPLSKAQLLSPTVRDNIAWLNTQMLSVYQHSFSLRYVHLDFQSFKTVVKFSDHLSITPTVEQGRILAACLILFEDYTEAEQQQLAKVLDNILYVFQQDTCTGLEKKITNILTTFGKHEFLLFGEQLDKIKDELKFNALELELTKQTFYELEEKHAQIGFYIFHNHSALLKRDVSNVCFGTAFTNSASMLDVMVASQLSSSLISQVAQQQVVATEIKVFSSNKNKMHASRRLQHAVYHQADLSKNLYQRELIQNAIDAIALKNRGNKETIKITLFQERDACVFRLEDNGCGMSLEAILKYFCIPGASTKRDEEKLIGQHGVGVFTAYHGASCIRIKSGSGDGISHYIELVPEYNDKNKIVDINISWGSKSESFQGVILERVSASKNAALEAAGYQRTLKKHAGFVNANNIEISLNDKVLNENMLTLYTSHINGLGCIRCYRASDNMVTSHGLMIKKIDRELIDFMPGFIMKSLLEKGIVIDLPSRIALNRERNDFVDKVKTLKGLRPHLYTMYIGAYIRLVQLGEIHFNDLPEDFFWSFDLCVRRQQALNPNLSRDAGIIEQGGELESYKPYHNRKNLIGLLTHLKLFTTMDGKKLSLIDIGVFYLQYKKLPNLSKTPCAVLSSVRYYTNMVTATSHHAKQLAMVTSQLGLLNTTKRLDDLEWVPMCFYDTPGWLYVSNITKKICFHLGYEQVNVGFSTKAPDALAYTYRQQEEIIIYWSVIACEKYFQIIMHDLAHNIFDTLSTVILFDLLNIISHELVHAALETTHDQTHNRDFYLKQIELLAKLFKKINPKDIACDMQQAFNKLKLGCETLKLSSQDFIEQQLPSLQFRNMALQEPPKTLLLSVSIQEVSNESDFQIKKSPQKRQAPLPHT